MFWRMSCLAPFWIVETTVLSNLCTEGTFCQCPVGQLVCNTILKDVNGRCYVEFFLFFLYSRKKSTLCIVIYLEMNIIVLITCTKQTGE